MIHSRDLSYFDSSLTFQPDTLLCFMIIASVKKMFLSVVISMDHITTYMYSIRTHKRAYNGCDTRSCWWCAKWCDATWSITCCYGKMKMKQLFLLILLGDQVRYRWIWIVSCVMTEERIVYSKSMITSRRRVYDVEMLFGFWEIQLRF